MNIKTYMQENKIKTSQISAASSLPYTTVSDIINGRTDIDNASVKVLIKLSAAFNMPLDEFYRLAKEQSPTPDLEDGYTLHIKNGKYYIEINGNKTPLCDNTPTNALFIKDIAQTFIKNIKRKERMSSWQTLT